MKEFAPFRLDLVNQCLWRNGEFGQQERVPLAPKAFALLSYLVNRAGRLVHSNELLEAAWPDTCVQPEVLKYQIAEIRRILEDPAKNPRFIETLPRRGYRFIAAVGEMASSQTAASGRTFVGRRLELALLRDALRRMLQGQRQVVFITGEPGIGKTALVDQFMREAVAAEPTLRVGRGQCVEGYGGSEAYYPMLEALGELCHGPDGERVVEILTACAPTLLVQFLAHVKPEHRETLQREIAGATRDRMLREIREAVNMLTAETPLLLVFEDLQWIDISSIDLLSALARERTAAKLMLVITKRPAEMIRPDHPLKRLKEDLLIHHLCQEIKVMPLSLAEVVEFLAAECPVGRLPEGFAELLYRRSEGNPLFLLAHLDRMIEDGQISCEHGKLELKVPLAQLDLAVPETLRQMIEAQIDRLTMEEQRALEAASVAGASFSVAVIAAVMKENADLVLDLFEKSSRRSLIIRAAGCQPLADGTVSQTFEFVHALYREVLYHRQTPGRTANLHRRIREQHSALFSRQQHRAAAKPG